MWLRRVPRIYPHHYYRLVDAGAPAHHGNGDGCVGQICGVVDDVGAELGERLIRGDIGDGQIGPVASLRASGQLFYPSCQLNSAYVVGDRILAWDDLVEA
jgi:hypothetical protein